MGLAPCRNGPSCRHLWKGTCVAFHSEEDIRAAVTAFLAQPTLAKECCNATTTGVCEQYFRGSGLRPDGVHCGRFHADGTNYPLGLTGSEIFVAAKRSLTPSAAYTGTTWVAVQARLRASAGREADAEAREAEAEKLKAEAEKLKAEAEKLKAEADALVAGAHAHAGAVIAGAQQYAGALVAGASIPQTPCYFCNRGNGNCNYNRCQEPNLHRLYNPGQYTQ
jgi:regulator of protease activity HflC (stomatin/prohibitin superfamily)